jgi:hypothetical protein
MDVASGNKQQPKPRATYKCAHNERLPNADRPFMQ